MMEALALVAKASSRHSLFKGVTLYKPTSKWRAQISHGGRTVTLGDYNTEEEAARVFDRACICKYGKDAVCNFPLEDYKDEWEELWATTIPSLLIKFKEERQRSKASRATTLLSPGCSALPQPPSPQQQQQQQLLLLQLQLQPPVQSVQRPWQQAAAVKSAPKSNGQSHSQGEPQPHIMPVMPALELVTGTAAVTPPAEAAASAPDGYAFAAGTSRAALWSPGHAEAPPPLARLVQHDRPVAIEETAVQDDPQPRKQQRQQKPRFPPTGPAPVLGPLAALPTAPVPAEAPPPPPPRHQRFQPHHLPLSVYDTRVCEPSDHGGDSCGAKSGFAAAATAGCAGGSPTTLLSRASSSPDLDHRASLARGRSLPGLPAAASDWAIMDAAPHGRVVAGPNEVVAVELWGGVAKAAARSSELGSQPTGYGGRNLPAWSRTGASAAQLGGHFGGFTQTEQAWDDRLAVGLAPGAVALDSGGGSVSAAEAWRRAVQMPPTARRPQPLPPTVYCEDFSACGPSSGGSGSAGGDDDDRSDSRQHGSRPAEPAGGSPLALALREHAVNRQRTAAAATQEDEQSGEFTFSGAELQGKQLLLRARSSSGKALQDLGSDMLHMGLANGARSQPVDWPPAKRLRVAAVAAAAATAAAARPSLADAACTTVYDGDPTASTVTAEALRQRGAKGGGGQAESYNPVMRPPAMEVAVRCAAGEDSGPAGPSCRAPWDRAWPQRPAIEIMYGSPPPPPPPMTQQRPGTGDPTPSAVNPPPPPAPAQLQPASRELGLEELQQALLAALLRREEQLLQEQQQQQQYRRQQQQQQQQQESLARLLKLISRHPLRPMDSPSLQGELSSAFGELDRQGLWHGGNAASSNVPSSHECGDDNGMRSEYGACAAMRCVLSPAAAAAAAASPPCAPQLQKVGSSNGGGSDGVAAVMSRQSSGVAPPASPSTSSSGGGEAAREVRFLTDTPTPTPTPVHAAANRSPRLHGLALRPPLTHLPNTAAEFDLSAPVDHAVSTAAAAATSAARKRALELAAVRTGRTAALGARLGPPAAPAAAAAAPAAAGAGASGPTGLSDAKWFAPSGSRVPVRDRAPSLRFAVGHDVEYDRYGLRGGSGGNRTAADDSESIDVPLVLRVPASMQEQVLEMLRLVEVPLQPKPLLIHTQGTGACDEGRAGGPTARRLH